MQDLSQRLPPTEEVKHPSRARWIAAAFAVIAVLAAAVFFVLSAARPNEWVLPTSTPDLANGEMLFHAGGCMACHGPPSGTDDSELPTGGAAFSTPIGTMYPGNLTPDPDTGIGRWTAEQFLDAMTEGVSPDQRHYFPAFPYTSYRNMRVEDLLDLRAYLMSLPPVWFSQRDAEVAVIGFARRTVGLWKRFAFRGRAFRPDPNRKRGMEPRRVPGAGTRSLRRVPHSPERLHDSRRHPLAGRRPSPAR